MEASLAFAWFAEVTGSSAAGLLQTAHRWCHMVDYPADDGLYLALAQRRQGVLLSQGRRLLRKVQGIPEARGWVMELAGWDGQR